MRKDFTAVAWLTNLGTFSALKLRTYRSFWSGLLAIYFGVQVQSLAAAWLAYELTRSPFKLGLVMAAWAVPVVLFSVFGGVVADRMPKRLVLIWSRLWISLITCVIATLIALGVIEFWHLVAAGVLLGFGYAFSMS
ncbi:MAG: MFS transporter, partial [Dehalococcoidia bacterium]|nr:MFS transporter [Dehalococcoidia bacterium]